MRRSTLVDLAIAAGTLAATLLLLVHWVDPAKAVLVAFASLPLVARRRAPLAVFAVTAVASSALNALGAPPGPPIGPTIALFDVGAAGARRTGGGRRTGAVVLTLLLVHVAAAGVGQGELPAVELLLGILVWGGAWVVGDRVRQRRERLAELEARAVRAEREVERERRLATAEERTRIARDLHDSAGHAINVILVQAGAARLLQDRDPAGAREALATIEQVARETIGEIDALVRALREDGSEAPPVEPPAGLAALETLLERHRSSGLAVELRVRGAARPLAGAVDRAAYRIVQEALTNAVRHGSGSAAVELSYGAAGLELEVTNPVAGDGPRGSGHGLVGMRERATLLGGTLEAGAGGGVFRVRATLPDPRDDG